MDKQQLYFLGMLVGISFLMVPAVAFVAKSRGRSAILYSIITLVWLVLWMALAMGLVLDPFIAAADGAEIGLNIYMLGILLGPGVVFAVPAIMLIVGGGPQEPHLTEEEILAEMERIRAEQALEEAEEEAGMAATEAADEDNSPAPAADDEGDAGEQAVKS